MEEKIVLALEYIGLAPGFVREVLEVYEAWEGKESVPMKVKELMLIFRIEVARRYNPYVAPERQKIKILRDTRLKEYPREALKTQSETTGKLMKTFQREESSARIISSQSSGF